MSLRRSLCLIQMKPSPFERMGINDVIPVIGTSPVKLRRLFPELVVLADYIRQHRNRCTAGFVRAFRHPLVKFISIETAGRADHALDSLFLFFRGE